MEIKGPTYPYVRLIGFGHFDLPVGFGKPQPEHSFDVLVQKAPESLQGSGETSMGLFKSALKNVCIPSWRYDRSLRSGLPGANPHTGLCQLPDVPLPGGHFFLQHFHKFAF